mmetsp:Transcript_17350/g.46838  ORF Transcript_17350/g.46838 Transcript_17350/m.46838 type:complete len:302 (+) Transcript_17350:203-1108(+)
MTTRSSKRRSGIQQARSGIAQSPAPTTAVLWVRCSCTTSRRSSPSITWSAGSRSCAHTRTRQSWSCSWAIRATSSTSRQCSQRMPRALRTRKSSPSLRLRLWTRPMWIRPSSPSLWRSTTLSRGRALRAKPKHPSLQTQSACSRIRLPQARPRREVAAERARVRAARGLATDGARLIVGAANLRSYRHPHVTCVLHSLLATALNTPTVLLLPLSSSGRTHDAGSALAPRRQPSPKYNSVPFCAWRGASLVVPREELPTVGARREPHARDTQGRPARCCRAAECHTLHSAAPTPHARPGDER